MPESGVDAASQACLVLHSTPEFAQRHAKVFGSGWAWLVYDTSAKALSVTSSANQDTPLMEPGKLPYYEVAGTIAGCKNCKGDDKIATDGPHKGKRVDASGEIVANYKECIAGYACKNDADDFDAGAAGDDNTKNDAEKVKHGEAGKSFTKEFTLPKSGGGVNKIMKVYFGGDDADGHIIEEEVRIEHRERARLSALAPRRLSAPFGGGSIWFGARALRPKQSQ